MNEQEKLDDLNAYLREIGFRPTEPQRELLNDVALGVSPILVQSASCTGKTTLAVVIAGFLSRSSSQVAIFTGSKNAMLPVARHYLPPEGNIKIAVADQGGCESIMALRNGEGSQVVHLIDTGSVRYHHWSAEDTPVITPEMLEAFQASMSPQEYETRILGKFRES